MTCSKCTQPAVTHIRYSGQHLCKEHFIRFFEKRAKMNVATQGRLPHGKVAVALSGGKDSVACLHFLHKISASNPHVELVAISVDEGIAGYRAGSLAICKEVTQRLGVPWHVVATKDLAGYTIDEYAAGVAGPTGEAARALRVAPPIGRTSTIRGETATDDAASALDAAPGKAGSAPGSRAAERAGAPIAEASAPAARPACSPCGVFRRQGINRLARQLGAAAVATGHNLDDMAQTIMMNVLGADVDRLVRLAPHDVVRPGMVPRILPFRNIPEKEVLLYCLLEGLPIHDEMECPYAARANRFAMRDMILDLEGRQPGTRHSLVRFHEDLRDRLPAARGEVGTCQACGEPTSAAVCRACLWQAREAPAPTSLGVASTAR